jgi:hypothetical protein
MTERRTARTRGSSRVADRREPADRDDLEVLDDGDEATVDNEAAPYDEAAVGEAAVDDEAAPYDAAAPSDEAAADENEATDGEDKPQANGRGGSVRGGSVRRARATRRPGLAARDAARAGLRQVAELTSNRPEGVTDVARTDDGWTVGVEVVEVERIPSSTDVLATYEVTIDSGGDLVSYRRIKRYLRGRGDSGEGL